MTRSGPLLPSRQSVAIVSGGALLVLGAVVLAAAVAEESFAYFVREPAIAVSLEGCDRQPCAYAGLLSNLGVLAWAVGAVCAGLAAVVSGDRMLAWGAGVTALLLTDDLFALHDAVFQWTHPRGQQAALAFLGATAVGYVLAFRHRIAGEFPGLVLIAGALLGASTFVDVVEEEAYLVEDSLKFVAIVFWAWWLSIAARRRLAPAPATASR